MVDRGLDRAGAGALAIGLVAALRLPRTVPAPDEEARARRRGGLILPPPTEGVVVVATSSLSSNRRE